VVNPPRNEVVSVTVFSNKKDEMRIDPEFAPLLLLENEYFEISGMKQKARESLTYGPFEVFDFYQSGDGGMSIEHLTRLLTLIQTIKLED